MCVCGLYENLNANIFLFLDIIGVCMEMSEIEETEYYCRSYSDIKRKRNITLQDKSGDTVSKILLSSFNSWYCSSLNQFLYFSLLLYCLLFLLSKNPLISCWYSSCNVLGEFGSLNVKWTLRYGGLMVTVQLLYK